VAQLTRPLRCTPALSPPCGHGIKDPSWSRPHLSSLLGISSSRLGGGGSSCGRGNSRDRLLRRCGTARSLAPRQRFGLSALLLLHRCRWILTRWCVSCGRLFAAPTLSFGLDFGNWLSHVRSGCPLFDQLYSVDSDLWRVRCLLLRTRTRHAEGQRCQLTDGRRAVGPMPSKRRDEILVGDQYGQQATEAAPLACRGCLLAPQATTSRSSGMPRRDG